MTAMTWFRIGAILALLAVAAGTFGAHWLDNWIEPATADNTEKLVSPERRHEVFQTGVTYHMTHALALLALGLLMLHAPGSAGLAATVAGWAFLFGVIVFSGSLYAIGLTGIGWLGMITPFGGFGFLIGWLALAIAAGPARA